MSAPPAPPAVAGVGARSLRFRREREATWRELARLVERIERRGWRRLAAEDLDRLPRLYRATLSALSVARGISLDRALLDYLESLCGRAYLCVYGPKRPLRLAAAELLRRGFPRALRAKVPLLAAAAAMLLAGLVLGFALVASDPSWFYALVSEDMAGGRTPAATTESLAATLRDEGSVADGLAVFASFLFTHNAGIGILCFALGFLLGLPTLFLLLSNGLVLGALSAVFHERGLALEWWGWILPHGITELLAIVVCGAAGLSLAHAFVTPGALSRRESLARRGREAGALVLGAVVMLFLAGLIEGFFRQLVTDTGVRWAVATATLGFWGVYAARAGREPPP